MSEMPLLARRAEAWDAEVGRRIRARRLECGFSQTELARRVGISFQQIQKYEKGVNRVSAGRLQRIGGALQVPMKFFYGAELPGLSRFKTSRLFYLLADRDALQLVTAFNRVSDRTLRRSFVRLLKELTHPKTVSRKKATGGRIRARADK
jgi:transcriptional regulator with XRE-family HTH domain